jgi:hypothetical protein
MNAAIIGISVGLISIVAIALLKLLDKKIIYGLVLTGIGFLYVGYTWMDITAVSINIVQAIFFMFLAYYGIKKDMYFMAAGYFLHGLWDLAYHLFANSRLIPPHYDIFCLSADFTIGFYLLIIQYQINNNRNSDKHETKIN